MDEKWSKHQGLGPKNAKGPNIISWLVVFRLPLWKMMEWKSVGMIFIPNWMESHKIHVPNHQSVRVKAGKTSSLRLETEGLSLDCQMGMIPEKILNIMGSTHLSAQVGTNVLTDILQGHPRRGVLRYAGITNVGVGGSQQAMYPKFWTFASGYSI